jgi:hypothetical protein
MELKVFTAGCVGCLKWLWRTAVSLLGCERRPDNWLGGGWAKPYFRGTSGWPMMLTEISHPYRFSGLKTGLLIFSRICLKVAVDVVFQWKRLLRDESLVKLQDTRAFTFSKA